jgi:type IV secretion system protein VirB11
VAEGVLNPDGRLWVDRLSGGLADTGECLAERIVRLAAHHVGVEVHPSSPRVSAELPETRERFEGLLPPVVTAPVFAIRKPAVAVFKLDDYVAAGIMTGVQVGSLREAVRERRDILVAGGTSTGKTTLTNSLLAEVAKTADRVVLIEDTRELQCRSSNLVALRTKDGVASLSDLVRSSLRLRPDRIPIGRCVGQRRSIFSRPRAPATLGVSARSMPARPSVRCTASNNSSRKPSLPCRALIAETIDVIAVLSGRGADRRLADFAHVDGLTPAGDYLISRLGDRS